MSGGVESPLSAVASSDRANGTPKQRHRQPLKPNTSGTSKPMSLKRQKSAHHYPHRTKFLLGGSISDPLNLNGLMNAKTSEPVAVERPPPRTDNVVNLILRPNIKDPLNLEGTYDEDHANLLSSEVARKKSRLSKDDMEVRGGSANLTRANFDEIRRNIAKRRRAHSFTVASSSCSSVALIDRQKSAPEGVVGESMVVVGQEEVVEEVLEERVEKRTVKIVEKPVVMEPEPKFEKNGFRFRFGNYNRYYGYRNPANEGDPRLDYFRQDWFAGKCVLDVGEFRVLKINLI